MSKTAKKILGVGAFAAGAVFSAVMPIPTAVRRRAELDDDGDIQIADSLSVLAEHFPAIRTPAVPLPAGPGHVARPCLTLFDELRDQHARGEYRLRAPAASPDGLAGPIRAQGYCLAPVFLDGYMTWYDPAMPAADGDIVLCEADPEFIREGVRCYRELDAFREAYMSGPLPNLMTKQLRHLNGRFAMDQPQPSAAARVLAPFASAGKKRAAEAAQNRDRSRRVNRRQAPRALWRAAHRVRLAIARCRPARRGRTPRRP